MIGNIFYAIAMDQHIKPLEIGELKLLISSEWLPQNPESNEAGISDEAHCMLITMDTLQANNVTADEAFMDFVNFYGLHHELFTRELLNRVVETARNIMRVFKADGNAQNRSFSHLKDLLSAVQEIPNKKLNFY